MLAAVVHLERFFESGHGGVAIGCCVVLCLCGYSVLCCCVVLCGVWCSASLETLIYAGGQIRGARPSVCRSMYQSMYQSMYRSGLGERVGVVLAVVLE